MEGVGDALLSESGFAEETDRTRTLNRGPPWPVIICKSDVHGTLKPIQPQPPKRKGLMNTLMMTVRMTFGCPLTQG